MKYFVREGKGAIGWEVQCRVRVCMFANCWYMCCMHACMCVHTNTPQNHAHTPIHTHATILEHIHTQDTNEIKLPYPGITVHNGMMRERWAGWIKLSYGRPAMRCNLAPFPCIKVGIHLLMQLLHSTSVLIDMQVRLMYNKSGFFNFWNVWKPELACDRALPATSHYQIRSPDPPLRPYLLPYWLPK